MTVTAPKTDAVLLAASDLARSVLEEVAEPGTIGAHLGMDLLEERLGMHWFECTSPGYRGWRWGVSVARVPRAKVATVCETNLLPGPDAVLAPEWLPYADRLAPGDLGAGDVLPFRPDDPNLEAGFEATGEEDVDQMAFFELGLGRPRVLSAEGREVRGDPVVLRRPRPDVRGRGQGDRALHDVRLLPADGRRAARDVRRVRQRVEPVRRPRRLARPRLRGALRDRHGPPRADVGRRADRRRVRGRPRARRAPTSEPATEPTATEPGPEPAEEQHGSDDPVTD